MQLKQVFKWVKIAVSQNIKVWEYEYIEIINQVKSDLDKNYSVPSTPWKTIVKINNEISMI